MFGKLPQTGFALTLIGVLALAGCGDDDETMGPGTGPAAVTDLAAFTSRDTVYVSWTPSAGGSRCTARNAGALDTSF